MQSGHAISDLNVMNDSLPTFKGTPLLATFRPRCPFAYLFQALSSLLPVFYKKYSCPQAFAELQRLKTAVAEEGWAYAPGDHCEVPKNLGTGSEKCHLLKIELVCNECVMAALGQPQSWFPLPQRARRPLWVHGWEQPSQRVVQGKSLHVCETTDLEGKIQDSVT